jgi:hypothetical protein
MLRASPLFGSLLLVCAALAQHPSTKPYPPDGAHPGPVYFADVAKAAGLTMLNVNGDPETKKYILETTGSGVAILDYDHDGWPDIFLVNGSVFDSDPRHTTTHTNHLYRNNHDGTFTDVTKAAGLDVSGWGQGVCVGDYDNDGYDDLYVTYYGKNRLFHNERNGTFKDVTAEAGVAGSGKEWGTGCAFVDYDRDGKLDLMVANYVHFDLATIPKPGEGIMCIWKGTPVMCGPRGLAYAPNMLFHNLGDGHFADVSKSSGIENTNGHYCFSVSTIDYNDDGWPDIYVACDSTPSILYRNNHDSTFTDVAAESGVAYDEDGREQAGMGSAIGDYDGDGHEDIFKTNFSDDVSSLYKNNGDGTFTSTIQQAGLGLNTRYLGWGVAFIDADNDGWPDLLLVNGHVYPEVDTAHLGSTYKQPCLFYWNTGRGTFKDLSKTAGPGCTTVASSRGMAVGDFWNDGRVSAVINNMDETPKLLVNLSPNSNHWVGISLKGTRSNRDSIGAKVTVTAGGRHYVQEVRSGSSYISNNDMRLHFGLGSSDRVTHITVRWQNGETEEFPGVATDRFISLTEGAGKSSAPPGAATH